MNNPRKVDVAYSRGHWLAQVAPDYDEPFAKENLQQLIDAVQRDWPAQALVFIVDYSTIEGIEDAESELLDISKMSGALIVSSDVRRSIRRTL